MMLLVILTGLSSLHPSLHPGSKVSADLTENVLKMSERPDKCLVCRSKWPLGFHPEYLFLPAASTRRRGRTSAEEKSGRQLMTF